MKTFCGFATVVAAVCFCSASQVIYSDEGYTSIKIVMDDDLQDRLLRVKPNVKYTVEMNSQDTTKDYKLSISVLQSDCSDTDAQIVFWSKTQNGHKQRNLIWDCEDEFIQPIRIYDSSTNSIEITGPDVDIAVKLLITAYTEISDDKECPGDENVCAECKKLKYVEEDDSRELNLVRLLNSKKNKTKRCISFDLSCNGRNNCADCNINEKDEANCSDILPCEECFWSGFHDTQYMLTILLAGLFFIMSPIVIVLVLFYHKRMGPSTRQNLRTRERSNVSNETITISPSRIQLRNDRPPTYEDVHDTKTPPPNFDDLVVQQMISEVNQTNTNSQIPQGISCNV